MEDAHGCTPIYLAVSSGNRELIHLLAKKGASLTHVNNYLGNTLKVMQSLYDQITINEITSVGKSFCALQDHLLHLDYRHLFFSFFFAIVFLREGALHLHSIHTLLTAIHPTVYIHLASNAMLEQLLLADLPSQKEAPIHRSFFRSSMREVNVLRIVRSFVHKSYKDMDWGIHESDSSTPENKLRIKTAASTLLSDSASWGEKVSATRELRRLLSNERAPPISETIETGVVPVLVDLLSHPTDDTIKFEATWALTNIASGTSMHTQMVVVHGAVEALIPLLSSHARDVKEQAIWALGNIAGDSYKLRDLILSNPLLFPSLENVIDINSTLSTSVSLQRNLAWFLSNLARGKPSPAFDTVRPILKFIHAFIHHSDHEVLTDIAWCLSYLTDQHTDEPVAEVTSATGCVPRLVELLSSTNPSVITPALRSVGNIATCGDLLTGMLINCGCIPSVLHLTSSSRKSIRKEAYWTLSNISAGSLQQVVTLIDAGVCSTIVQDMVSINEFDVWKEACWCLCNLSIHVNHEKVHAALANPQGLRALLSRAHSCHEPSTNSMVCASVSDLILSKGTTPEMRSELLSTPGIYHDQSLNSDEFVERLTSICEVAEPAANKSKIEQLIDLIYTERVRD